MCTRIREHVQQEHAIADELEKVLPDIVKQFDTTANNNIAIAGVVSALYSSAIFAGRVNSSSPLNAILYALPLCLLLASIIFALRVYYPDGYYQENNYRALIKEKEKRLQFSYLLLEIALGVRKRGKTGAACEACSARLAPFPLEK